MMKYKYVKLILLVFTIVIALFLLFGNKKKTGKGFVGVSYINDSLPIIVDLGSWDVDLDISQDTNPTIRIYSEVEKIDNFDLSKIKKGRQ